MDNFKIKKFSQHVYLLPPDHRTDRPVLGVIAGTESALIVDAGNSPEHVKILLKEIKKLNISQPKYCAVTHWHWDHVFGIHEMNLVTISHSYTKSKVDEMKALDWSDEALDERVENGSEIEFCRDMIKAELPDRSALKLKAPDIIYETGIKVDLGNIVCSIDHVGGDHSPDSSVIFIPEDKVLFIGDSISQDIYNGERHWTKEKLYPLMDKLLDYDADWYIHSHSEEAIPRQELEEYFEMLRTIRNIIDVKGSNREAIVLELEKQSNRPVDEEQQETIDAFIAGLSEFIDKATEAE